MPAVKLNQHRVDVLKPRKSVYDMRDRDLTGFGLRIWPSGKKRYFIHSQHSGRRIWKTVANAESANVDEARARAAAMLAAMRRGGDAPESSEVLFEVVADEVFTRYARNWKPGTLKVNRNYFCNHILLRFKGRPIADIDRTDVRQWFASLHAKPAAADRSAPILSVIMHQAEVYGYRPEGSNPCKGIKRHRRKGREQFLTEAEIGSLAVVLRRFEANRPQQVAIIKLLLLTGCRASEVRTLKWNDRREGRLFLPDSKTGPRTVWLSSAARAVMDRLPQTARWMFPSRRTNGPLSHGALDETWRQVREEADLRDVRLHDLRHTFASHAVLQGIPLPVVSRLLGHKRPSMTLRYAHVGDRETEAAAERIGAAIARALDVREAGSPD